MEKSKFLYNKENINENVYIIYFVNKLTYIFSVILYYYYFSYILKKNNYHKK